MSLETGQALLEEVKVPTAGCDQVKNMCSLTALGSLHRRIGSGALQTVRQQPGKPRQLVVEICCKNSSSGKKPTACSRPVQRCGGGDKVKGTLLRLGVGALPDSQSECGLCARLLVVGRGSRDDAFGLLDPCGTSCKMFIVTVRLLGDKSALLY